MRVHTGPDAEESSLSALPARRCWLALGLGLAAAGSGCGGSLQPWTLTITVTTDRDVDAVAVETAWLGERTTVALSPTPRNDHTTLWHTTLDGPPVRVLPVSIWMPSPMTGERRRAHQALEVLTVGDQGLHYAVDETRPAFLRRVPSPGTTTDAARRDNLALAGSMGWGIAALLGVLGLWWRPSGSSSKTVSSGTSWAWWEPLGWLGFAAVWTWPAAIAGPTRIAGRHFDALGTVWFIDAAPRLLSSLTDPLTGWPAGADYTTADSYVLLAVASALSWLHPAAVHGWLAVVGVAASGWAASVFAFEVGARGVYRWLAGLFFAAGGLAANALLEGHAYHVVNPWMPLFALTWWRATSGVGRIQDGVLAGVFFALALGTTGYLGVATALLAVGFFVDGALRHGGRLLAPVAGSLAVVVPVLAGFLWLHSGLDAEAGSSSTMSLQTGSLHLLSLAGPTPEVDRLGHSLALSLPSVCVALALLSAAVLPRRGRWWVLASVAAGALVLAAGPGLSDGISVRAPSPLGWVWSIDTLSRLRFPVRLAWAALLCVGALAGAVATRLLEGRPRVGMVLMVAASVESLWIVGLPLRQASRLATVPSAYRDDDGPVLDLLPTMLRDHGELDSWLNATTCLHQTGHGRAIAEDCVHVPIDPTTDRALTRAVGAMLLDGDATSAYRALSSQGFSQLAVQPDLFSHGDWQRIEPVLAALDAQPTESHDGGAWVRVYDVAPPSQHPSAAPVSTDHTVLQLDLVTPSRQPGRQYAAEVVHPDGAVHTTPLRDDGHDEHDRPRDGIHTAELTIVHPGGATLRILDPRTRAVLWQGDLHAHGEHDHRAFYQEVDGQVVPVLFGFEDFAPGAATGTAKLARIGGGVWGALAFSVAAVGLVAPAGRTRRRRTRGVK